VKDRFRWHRVYFALAAFDLLTIGFSLYVNHELTALYSTSVATNREWAARLGSYSELAGLAQVVNAPGNDVFDSGAVADERARMRSTADLFTSRLRLASADIPPGLSIPERNAILASFDRLEASMAEMTAEQELMFAYMAAGDVAQAGRRNATMDRAYGKVTTALTDLTGQVRAIQQEGLGAQELQAQSIRRYEYIIAGAILLMIVAVVVYGHHMATATLRASEALRIAKDEAEAANHAKSTFLANMSHELRTPLNAVIGYSEMLKEDLAETQPPQVLHDLDSIRQSGRQLLTLINEVLDFSKIEAGKMQLHLEDFEISTVVEEAVTSVRPDATKRGNQLTVTLADDLGQMRSDVTRVRQVLLNLLSNGVKFTDHGTVSVHVYREEAGRPDSTVVFEIADSGIGISDEQRAKLFQPFTQAEASTTRRFGGTGLGLALCQRLVMLLGGTLEVDSELGRGSTFSVRLPAPAQPAVPVTPKPESAKATATPILRPRADHDRLNVLVIDDDDFLRDLFSRELSARGFDVVATGDPEQAIALARQSLPDVVMLDVLIGGWVVLDALKRDPATGDIPVVMTAVSTDRARGFALGAADYLVKPVDINRLVSVLRRVSSPHAAPTALIVEDDVQSRQLVARLLQKEGWTTVEADNGRVGLERLTEVRPQLIILDLMMPEVDGFQFADALRGQPTLRDIPIVVLTAKDITDEDRHRLDSQVVRLLEKSEYGTQELVALVHEAAMNGKARTAA
jgi:signal transduction histidine kinase/DNA-binding response OmpR family regulator